MKGYTSIFPAEEESTAASLPKDFLPLQSTDYIEVYGECETGGALLYERIWFPSPYFPLPWSPIGPYLIKLDELVDPLIALAVW